MFRELNRKSRELFRAECLEVLTKETRGVLSVNGDDGYPYGMPINFYYSPEDGCIYFHSGKRNQSHRMDALKRSDKACFCVVEQGTKAEGEWAYTARSVIVFGRVEIIDDAEIAVPIAVALSHKFTDDEHFIRREVERFAKATTLFKLIPEHMCGKRVKEE